MGVRMQCIIICARTRAPQTLSGSWATQNRQFMTTKNAYRAIIDVAKGIGELSPARKQHKQCRDSLDETDRDLGRFMLRLAANMGVQKSTIIDVMSSLGWKRWPGGAPHLSAGWGPHLQYQGDSDLAVPESLQLLGERRCGPKAAQNATSWTTTRGELVRGISTVPPTTLWTP